MGVLTCDCANVKVYTASNDQTLTEFTLPKQLLYLLESDAFFQHVSIHRFGLGGVRIVCSVLTFFGRFRRLESSDARTVNRL